MDPRYIVRGLLAMALAQDPVFGGNIRMISINGTRNMLLWSLLATFPAFASVSGMDLLEAVMDTRGWLRWWELALVSLIFNFIWTAIFPVTYYIIKSIYANFLPSESISFYISIIDTVPSSPCVFVYSYGWTEDTRSPRSLNPIKLDARFLCQWDPDW